MTGWNLFLAVAAVVAIAGAWFDWKSGRRVGSLPAPAEATPTTAPSEDAPSDAASTEGTPAGEVAGAATVGEGMEGDIPNALTLGVLVLAPIGHFIWGFSLGGFRAGLEWAGFSVAGALVCGIVPLMLWRSGAMGGGDVKLLAAIGAVMRPMVGIEAEFYAFAAAALIAPARLAWEGKLLRTLGNTLSLVVNPLLPKAKRREISRETMTWFRFGPAIALGTVVAALLHWQLGSPTLP